MYDMENVNSVNPFPIKGYISRDLFCDRKEELDTLIENVRNGVDTTLISDRRMGKTGLIWRLFEEIKLRALPIVTINVDIFPTSSLSDFINVLYDAVSTQYPVKTDIGRRFMKFVKSLRPMFSTDPMTGEMKMSVLIQNDSEREVTLSGILNFLDSQGCRVLLAIDEFQQIRRYPQANVEALLRTYIQRLKNLTFIFCGSSKHLMTDIFQNSKSPFYASTRFLWLGKIDSAVYSEFISRKFSDRKVTIEPEATDLILKWTMRHTFYTQCVCNQLFTLRRKHLGIPQVRDVCVDILKTNEMTYLQYKLMLTTRQWEFLIALARRESICSFQSYEFLQDSGLRSAASSKRITDSLIDKGLITTEIDEGKVTYKVSDVFFMRWLQSKYR